MTELVEPREAPLISASRLLAERAFYGIVWADQKLEVTARYGELVDFVDIGSPLTESLLPLMGLESDLRALRRKPKSLVELPSVTIVTRGGRTPRMNLAVVWSVAEGSYLVLASRANMRSDLEDELNRQIRARLIAEADLQVKSTELQRANNELERTNADLEQFASVISHDLKSPMRALRALIDDAEVELQTGRTDAARQIFSDIREQSLRMSQMLTGLLGYATAGRLADMLERVDTKRLVASVVSGLDHHEGLAVEIAGVWPEITTYSAPFDLVLRNLIDNAIAHHDRDEGRITVLGEDGKDELIVSVIDDGPGILPEHQSVIFLPYRTLSQATSRSGMGLSLLTRALDAVGGRIAVISDPHRGRGTVFRVHWPKSNDR